MEVEEIEFDINETFQDVDYHYPENCSWLLDENNLTYFNDTNCNLSSLFTGEKSRMNIPAAILTQLFYAITCVVGLCGNTLVIYVVTRFSKMQTTTNMYILNLAIADELFVLGIPFLMVTSILHYWAFGSYMCKMYMITTSLNQFTSSLFLTIMSADRYMAVCHPINAPKFRTPMISKLVSLTAWTISALMIVPVFMYSDAIEDPNGLITCNIFWPESNGLRGEIAFIRYSFVLAFGIPLCLIFIFYTLVLHKLRSVGPKTKSKEKRRSRQKVTKLVLTVCTVYVLCWLPYWVLQLTLILSEPKKNHSRFMIILFLISSCLSYINSALNPILYAFLSDNFKKSFKKACTCATQKEINNSLKPENSMFPLKHRGMSTRLHLPHREGREADRGSTSHGCYSKDPSTAMTSAVSRPNNIDQITCKNGRLAAPATPSPGTRLPDLLQ
ncbi:unnamed protein product [Meganyctiphanes norvegica]|uniref:G-protein coupled receptors family 1 profile domain-containing protein n=1 Tax=Meganyctiphanes norvegica TaxID=48144 RepID=A0AAV2S9M3_MEGNR